MLDYHHALSDCAEKALKGSKILVLGVAYKKDINDQRESPSFQIMDLLLKRGAVVNFHDPHIPEILPSRHFPQFNNKKSVDLSEGILKSYDAVILVTDHSALDYPLILKHAKIIIDTRNAFPANAKNTVRA